MRVTPPLLALLTALALLPIARAAVRVSTGPTPISDRAATSPGEITIVNERLAFALAVRAHRRADSDPVWVDAIDYR
ncbi:MAG: hypothetical protein ACLPTM_05730 [Steroidobacteraceae bacterium]